MFIHHADFDVMAFALLARNGLFLQSQYHAVQALEKYLKALALSIVDPPGANGTPMTSYSWLRGHSLSKLATRCAGAYPFWATASVVKTLARFDEYDQATRYPWVARTQGHSFLSADVPVLARLIQRARTDIPIPLDDYQLGILIRGHHFGRPDALPTTAFRRLYAQALAAITEVFDSPLELVRR